MKDNEAVAQDTDRSTRNDAVVSALRVSPGTFSGWLDLQSFDSDGFTLVVDDQLNAGEPDFRVCYLALGGDSLTNAFAGNFALSTTGTGDQAVTGVGFQPDCVIILGQTGQTATPNDGSHQRVGLGWAVSTTSEITMGFGVANAVAAVDSSSYGRSDELSAVITGGEGISNRFDLTSFDADGFTINRITTPAQAAVVAYLALKGGSYASGELLTKTDTSTAIDITGLSFKPAAVLFGSVGKAESTAGTPTAHLQFSLGAATSPTSRLAHAWHAEDNLSPSQVNLAVEYDACYIHIANADTVDGLMDLTSMNSDGFSCIMDDADPSANWVGWLAFGPAADGGGGADDENAARLMSLGIQ
jgi:hypothetical protein